MQVLQGCWSSGTVRCVQGRQQVLQQSVLLFPGIDRHALHFIAGFATDLCVRESRSLKTFKFCHCLSLLSSYCSGFYYGTMTLKILLS